MSLHDEIDQAFEEAKVRIAKQLPPPGVLPADSDPSPQVVTINENFSTIVGLLHLLADRLEAIEQRLGGEPGK